MKNLKKIISFVCVAAMMLSLSAFADGYVSGQDLGVALKASKTTVAPGETFTVTVYAKNLSETFKTIPTGAVDYNSDEFTFAYSGSDANIIMEAGSQIGNKDNGVAFAHTAEVTFNNPADMWTFDVTAGSTPGTYTIELMFMFVDNGGIQAADSMDELTITVEAADPKPQLKNTYTLGDITYTDVPNITVTKNLTSADFSGNLLIDYTKGGVEKSTSKFFESTVGKFTGTAGDVTFDIAVINVPADVVVTAMDVAVD